MLDECYWCADTTDTRPGPYGHPACLDCQPRAWSRAMSGLVTLGREGDIADGD